MTTPDCHQSRQLLTCTGDNLGLHSTAPAISSLILWGLMRTVELDYIKKVMGGKADTWLRTPFFKVRSVTEKHSTRTEEFRATSLLCARFVLSPKAVKKLAWRTKGQALIEKEGRAGPGAGAAGTALNRILGSVRLFSPAATGKQQGLQISDHHWRKQNKQRKNNTETK